GLPLTIHRASADFNQADWGVERAIDGKSGTAWGIHPAVGTNHVAVFELDEGVPVPAGSRFAISLRQSHGGSHLIGAFRLSATSDSAESTIPFSTAQAAALDMPESERTPAQQAGIASAILGRIARMAL